jgi:hypothetical protein
MRHYGKICELWQNRSLSFENSSKKRESLLDVVPNFLQTKHAQFPSTRSSALAFTKQLWNRW